MNTLTVKELRKDLELAELIATTADKKGLRITKSEFGIGDWSIYAARYVTNRSVPPSVLGGFQRQEGKPIITSLASDNHEIDKLRLSWRQLISDAPDDLAKKPAAALLRSARPMTVKDSTVTVAFKFPIHKYNMEKADNQKIAEKIISNFLGRYCHVRCILQSGGGHWGKACPICGDVVTQSLAAHALTCHSDTIEVIKTTRKDGGPRYKYKCRLCEGNSDVTLLGLINGSRDTRVPHRHLVKLKEGKMAENDKTIVAKQIDTPQVLDGARIDALLRGVDENTALSKRLQAENAALLAKCKELNLKMIDYAARIVELQNQVAVENRINH